MPSLSEPGASVLTYTSHIGAASQAQVRESNLERRAMFWKHWESLTRDGE